MFASLYTYKMEFIGNVASVDCDIIQRAHDLNTITASGSMDFLDTGASFIIFREDKGRQIHSCLVDTIDYADSKSQIKGLDLRKIWDTEVLLDFSDGFSGALSDIANKVWHAIIQDRGFIEVPCRLTLAEEIYSVDTSAAFGILEKTYIIVNAYRYMNSFLKYYGFRLDASIDSCDMIHFQIKKTKTLKNNIRLNDFVYERMPTPTTVVNKTIATISTDSMIPRPPEVAKKYYFLTDNNDIVEYPNAQGPSIAERKFPVITKVFEAEYLGVAQFEAVQELANNRYADSITIEDDVGTSPISLSDLELGELVGVYNAINSELDYKELPVSEIQFKVNGAKTSRRVKLGYRRILLTEILKR